MPITQLSTARRSEELSCCCYILRRGVSLPRQGRLFIDPSKRLPQEPLVRTVPMYSAVAITGTGLNRISDLPWLLFGKAPPYNIFPVALLRGRGEAIAASLSTYTRSVRPPPPPFPIVRVQLSRVETLSNDYGDRQSLPTANTARDPNNLSRGIVSCVVGERAGSWTEIRRPRKLNAAN